MEDQFFSFFLQLLKAFQLIVFLVSTESSHIITYSLYYTPGRGKIVPRNVIN